MENNLLIRKLPTFGQILVQTFVSYQTHIYSIFKIVLLFFIPFTIFEYGVWHNEWLSNQIAVRMSKSFINVFDIGFVIGIFLFFLTYLFSLIYSINAFDQNKKISIKEIYQQGKKLFFPWMKLNILYLFKVFVWSLVFIIPGIVKLFSYSLVSFIFLFEQKSIQESFAKSEQEIMPHILQYSWQAFFLTFSIGAVIFSVINVFDLLIVVSGNQGLEWLSIIFSICEAFLIFMIGAMLIVFYHQYYKYLIKQVDIEKGCYGKSN